MGNTVPITVDNPDDLLNAGLYGAAAVIRIQSSATVDGVYANLSGTGATSTLPLVSTKYEYEGYDPAGLATTWYRTRFESADAVRWSDWSVPSQPQTQFVPTRTVRALVKTALSDDQVADVIQREEEILAAEVGPLAGARTETFTITEDTAGYPIRLRRPTAAVTVTEANAAVTDVRLASDGRTVLRLTASGWASTSWLGVVEATSTPSDLAKVTTWVIELVRARLAKTGYLDEENTDRLDYDATLAAAVADILRPARAVRRNGLYTVRLSTGGDRSAWLGTVRP